MSQESKDKKTSPEKTIFIDGIIGFVKTVTTIPAYTPKRFDQAIRIYMDSITSPTTKRLYIYSFEAKIWNYLTLT